MSENAQRLIIILNPTAGKGRAGQELVRVRHLLTQREIEAEVFLTREPGDPQRILRDLPLPAGTVVVAAGGDGTVHECGLALMEFDGVELAVLPLGSGNDYATMMGMPQDLYAALDAIILGETVRLDVGSAGPHLFLNSVGLAFSAAVSRESRKTGRLAGLPRYLVATVRAAARHRPLNMGVDGLSEGGVQKVALMEVAVGPLCGGGFRLAPDAQPADGLLDVCMIRHMPMWKMLMLLPRGLRGTHITHENVLYEQVPSFRLKLEADTLVHVDGELQMLPRGEHTLKILPRALPVRVPAAFAQTLVTAGGARAA